MDEKDIILNKENIEIVKIGDPILRKKAKPVDHLGSEIDDIVHAMFKSMKDNNGIGLAAPQIGLSLKIITVGLDEFQISLINPVIAAVSKETEELEEGCLSVPDVSLTIKRPEIVLVNGYTPRGDKVSLEVDGLVGRVIQHEIDHLDGILIVDRASPEEVKEVMKKKS